MAGETNPAHDDEPLLAELGWIKKLARRMSDDAHRADDLAQETYAIALHTPPRAALSLRGWLRTVMQNLVRQGGRGAERRLAREVRAARAEHVDATDEVLARAEVQRRIVDAVFALDEPYRSTILLRFFEDLPPREIARRQGVPATTVQSRLTRAIHLLRERLDTDHGGRSTRGAWLALLVPLAVPPRTLVAPALGGLIVNAKLILGLVSVAVVVTVVAILQLDDSAQRTAATMDGARDTNAAALEDRELASGLLVPGAAPAREQASPDAPVARATQVPPASALHRVRGRVLDAEGLGVGGIALAFEPDGRAGEPADSASTDDARVRTQSGAGGAFEIETAASGGTIAVDDARFATVRAGWYRSTSGREPIVIFAPAIELGGNVLDPHRSPLQGARVSLAMPSGFGTRFGESLEATSVLAWTALTDAHGRFALGRVPQVDGSTVRVLVDGYEPAIQPEPALSDTQLLFVLQRPAVLARGALHGRVLDDGGRAVPGARVAVGVTSGVTNEQGEFALDLSRAVTADAVTAVKAGFRPARMERPSEPAGDDTGWPEFVELRLGGPALSIRGRVVDERGEPRGGMRVWVSDPTPFGLIGRVPAQSESLMAGAALPEHALEPDPNPPREDGDNEIVNRNAGAPPSACWYWVVTGDDGRFDLPGLDARKYKLRVLDTRSLQQVTSDPIEAGDTDARIVVPKPAAYEKLAGRIVTVGDRPVAGVRVMLRTTCFDVHTRYFGGTLDVLMMSAGGETTTDAAGRFELADVPRDGVFFVLRSDQLVPCDWHIPAGADPAHLDVRVDVRCQLDVRLSAPLERADEFVLFDERGEVVDLIEMHEERVHTNSSGLLVGGRSGVLSASSSARTLELRKNGASVEKRAIQLSPDTVTVIEL
ncbi:MAG: sigma-70 family RNA polymerase sigma factor [Planctomycetota bacterium]